MTITIPAPSACGRCEESPGMVFDLEVEPIGVGSGLFVPCPDCTCIICGRHTDVIGGECGGCFVDEDCRAARREDL